MNIYLKLINDAHRLPDSYRAMGTAMRTFQPTDNGQPIRGWHVCQYMYQMNRDDPEWWSTDCNLIVDESGDLWSMEIGEHYLPDADQCLKRISIGPVNGEQLRIWHSNGWDFQKIKRAIEAMV